MEHVPRFILFFQRLKLLVSDNKRVREELISPAEQLTDEESDSPSPRVSRPAQIAFVVPDSPPLSHHLNFTETDPSECPSLRTSKKRPNSLTLTNTSPRKVRHTSEHEDIGNDNPPLTPDNPPVPKDPTYSGDSVESIDEDNTKQMITTFVVSTLTFLGEDFNLLSWPFYTGNCLLETGGYANFLVRC
jgi:hypothetical protein